MVLAAEKQRTTALQQKKAEAGAAVSGECPAPGSTRSESLLPASRYPWGDGAASGTLPSSSISPSSTNSPPPGALERWMQSNWTALVVASLLSTTGMALALLPLLRRQIEPIWPWAPTHLSLVAAIPLVLAVLVLSLSMRQIRLSSWRRSLDATSEAHMQALVTRTAAMQREVQELEEQIAARREVERTLQAVADTLREQVQEEKRQAERQGRHLHAVRRAAEVQNTRLRELHKLAQTFVNHVSHEFRTPITVIREYAQTLNDGLLGTIDRQQQDCIKTILARVDDLFVMVNDLEDISRLEANVLYAVRRPCAATDVFDRAIPMLQRKAAASGVPLIVRLDEDLPRLFCDADKAARVLVNLGVNAIKYSEEGQPVVIACEHSGEAPEVTVRVSDRGPGIPADQLERIFRSFEQLDTNTRSSTKGFGLGLTIVRELVSLNFGRIDVESTLGTGSTFRFTLPLAAPRSFLPLFAERARRAGSPSQHLSILIASTGEEASPGALEEAERFLQGTVRRTDVVHAAGEGHWLILAMAEGDDLHRMIQRLARCWTQVDASLHGSLPPLHWRVAGSFDPLHQMDAFIETFLYRQERLHPHLPAPQDGSHVPGETDTPGGRRG